MPERFPSPFELPAPPGAEGWEDMYAYSLPFSEDRREDEEAAFWFTDSLHWSEPVYPWDATFMEFAFQGLGQANTRQYVVPPALGIQGRILNGYIYLSPVGVADPSEIPGRVDEFMQRAGYYFMNWNDLYAKWKVKLKDLIDRAEAVDFSPLPDRVPMEWITEGRGLTQSYDLYHAYHTLVDIAMELWQYHFEFLNLGYAAYLDFFGFCKEAFPDIPDLSIARMVAGIDVDLYRPDLELRRLALKAIELGVTDTIMSGSEDAAIAATRASGANGAAWVADWEAIQEPWFHFSSGTGWYHTDRVWREYKDVPLDFLRTYISKAQQGVDITRPTEKLKAERERIADEYRDFLATDEDRQNFEMKLGLAKIVFHYVEEHNFYVEHWGHSVIWRKLRDLGKVFLKEGFFTHEDDIFYLQRDEIPAAIFDMTSAWAVGAKPRGPAYWGKIVPKRRATMEALRQWSPPPALGAPPEVVTEPFTIMLWGITSATLTQWLSDDDGSGGLKGMTASPGAVEGVARVIMTPNELNQVQDGEILVCPVTAPSWGSVFAKVGAVVTDIGGMMSHAAILCREYGMPAVTGTAYGTKQITTGMRVRVDGTNGTVTILDPPA